MIVPAMRQAYGLAPYLRYGGAEAVNASASDRRGLRKAYGLAPYLWYGGAEAIGLYIARLLCYSHPVARGRS